jgi:hypothetical protein
MLSSLRKMTRMTGMTKPNCLDSQARERLSRHAASPRYVFYIAFNATTVFNRFISFVKAR